MATDADGWAVVAAVVTLLILDLLWITIVMGPRYRDMIAHVQGDAPMHVRVWPAVVAYVLMCVGMLVFVLPRVRDATRRRGKSAALSAILFGGGFGVVLYGVYDATAAAVMKDWSIPLALIDVAWGGAVFTAAAYAGS